MARRVAEALPARPDFMDLARSNLRRWSALHADSPSMRRCHDEWRAILERSTAEIQAILTAPTDEGQRLRQTSPFVGALSPREVWAIKQRHWDEAAGP